MCAKQVPDPEVRPRLDPVTFRLARDGAAVLDDADAAGISVALSLGADELVLVSMGPADDLTAVRKGLALGASSAVVVSDGALGGADARTTAVVLAAAVRRAAPPDLGEVDLVVAGTVSADGYTGVLASMLAELLGLPALTFARRVALDAEGGGLRAERETEAGYDEVSCPLPCVLSVMTGSVPARYPSYKAIVDARRKPVEVVGLAELGVTAPEVGQELIAVAGVPARAAGEIVDDDGRGHERILERLVALKAV